MSQQPPPPAPTDPREETGRTSRSALEHYRRGNRFFDLKAWDRALEEWRRAAALWPGQRRARKRGPRPLAQLRAAVLLLLTVLLVYNGLFHFFPRDSMEFVTLGSDGGDGRSWWERWLDTGRPQAGDGVRMDLREWWLRLRERWSESDEEAARGGNRPRLDERWEELLRRYGRFGTFPGDGLDYHVIAGYGLSRLGDYGAAVAAFEQGLRRASGARRLGELYQGLANTHYQQGYRLQPDGLATYDLALVKKAVDAYERSVRYVPLPLSFGNMGWMYFLLGDYPRSEQFSRRALGLDPSLDYVRLNLGLTYLMQGRVQDAFITYRQMLRRNPPAEAYLGGMNDLREILRDHPGRYPFAYLMLGMLAVKSGDFTQANEALGRFASAPSVGESWRQLGARLQRTMDISEVER
jgi:tetratricopeptide (TPR) repeat protein